MNMKNISRLYKYALYKYAFGTHISKDSIRLKTVKKDNCKSRWHRGRYIIVNDVNSLNLHFYDLKTFSENSLKER